MTGIPTMEEFSEKMRQIYTKIRNSERDVYEKGLIADPEVINRKGAYLVAYRFSDYFTEELENISFKISNLAPAVFYKRRNIHSTIISYKLSDNFHPDQTIIKSLMQAVYSGMIKRFLIPVINYRELIFNQNSVILEGSPDVYDYYESVKDIIESCYENNLDVNFPWGCHITVSRFSRNIHPQSQEQKRFLSLDCRIILFCHSREGGNPVFIA